jgi:MFS family permease
VFAVIRRNRNLRLLFLAEVVSYLGDWFTFVALSGLVDDETHSRFLVSVLLVVYSLPTFLVAPLAGAMADRFDRRKILIVVSLLQCGGALMMLAANGSHIWIAFVSQSIVSGLSSFVRPSIDASVPNIATDDEELNHANALFGSTWGIMLAVGASIGGAFSAAFGRRTAFVADAITFIIAAGLVLLVNVPLQQERTARATTRVKPIEDMREAIGAARRDPVLFALLMSKATFAIGTGVVTQLAILASDVFHGGDTARGVMIGARGIGAALGPIIAARWAGRDLRRILFISGVTGLGFALFYGTAAWSPTLIMSVTCVAIAHLGGGAQWTLSTLGLQIRADDSIRGRILAGDLAGVTLMLAIASSIASVISGPLGARWTMTIFSGAAGVAAIFYLTLTRHIRESLRVPVPA